MPSSERTRQERDILNELIVESEPTFLESRLHEVPIVEQSARRITATDTILTSHLDSIPNQSPESYYLAGVNQERFYAVYLPERTTTEVRDRLQDDIVLGTYSDTYLSRGHSDAIREVIEFRNSINNISSVPYPPRPINCPIGTTIREGNNTYEFLPPNWVLISRPANPIIEPPRARPIRRRNRVTHQDRTVSDGDLRRGKYGGFKTY